MVLVGFANILLACAVVKINLLKASATMSLLCYSAPSSSLPLVKSVPSVMLEAVREANKRVANLASKYSRMAYCSYAAEDLEKQAAKNDLPRQQATSAHC